MLEETVGAWVKVGTVHKWKAMLSAWWWRCDLLGIVLQVPEISLSDLHRPVDCGHTHFRKAPTETTTTATTIQSKGAPLSFATMRLRREEAPPPFRGVESPSLPRWWPNPSPALPPYVVRTPHLRGAPTTEETSVVEFGY